LIIILFSRQSPQYDFVYYGLHTGWKFANS